MGLHVQRPRPVRREPLRPFQLPFGRCRHPAGKRFHLWRRPGRERLDLGREQRRPDSHLHRERDGFLLQGPLAGIRLAHPAHDRHQGRRGPAPLGPAAGRRGGRGAGRDGGSHPRGQVSRFIRFAPLPDYWRRCRLGRRIRRGRMLPEDPARLPGTGPSRRLSRTGAYPGCLHRTHPRQLSVDRHRRRPILR